MSIEVRQLRYFRSLARELNFRRAAAAVNISQSTLSEQIQRLEDVIGVTLLDRSNRLVRLTPAGLLLGQRSEIVLADIARLVEEVRRAAGVVRRTLRIGYSEMAIGTVMPTILHAFREQYPHIETILSEQSSSGAEGALLDGCYDCLFVPGTNRPPAIAALELGQEPILVCLPASSKLAAQPRITLADLSQQPLILPDESSKLSSYIEGTFAKAGIIPRIAARASRALSILTLVASETGIAFIPRSLSSLAPAAVVVRSLDSDALQIGFGLIWRANSTDDAVGALVQVAKGIRTEPALGLPDRSQAGDDRSSASPVAPPR